MYEVSHLIEVLESTKKALAEENILALRELSNQTIHSSTTKQDSASIALMVIIYTLGKLVERGDIKNPTGFRKKISELIDKSISSLKQENFEEYRNSIEKLREAITPLSGNMKQYIQEVIRKASVNKASKLYEHGISLEQTSKLLGITQWELADYIGQSPISEARENQTIDIKKRAKLAMEFFSGAEKSIAREGKA